MNGGDWFWAGGLAGIAFETLVILIFMIHQSATRKSHVGVEIGGNYCKRCGLSQVYWTKLPKCVAYKQGGDE